MFILSHARPNALDGHSSWKAGFTARADVPEVKSEKQSSGGLSCLIEQHQIGQGQRRGRQNSKQESGWPGRLQAGGQEHPRARKMASGAVAKRGTHAGPFWSLGNGPKFSFTRFGGGSASPQNGRSAGVWEGSGHRPPSEDPCLPSGQDCLRACQEQIEALLESSLRQAQQQSLDPKAAEEEEEEEEADLACTPTDVRDVNI